MAYSRTVLDWREVGEPFADRLVVYPSEDLDRLLIREGLARDYTRYSRGAYLEETRARVGTWSDK